MVLSLVCPQGCNRSKGKITVSFGTRDLALHLWLIQGTFLCGRVTASFMFLCSLFLFALLAVSQPNISIPVGFAATFFALQLNVTVPITSKFLLVLQELFHCLETSMTFEALVGIDITDHYRALGMHCNAMLAES